MFPETATRKVFSVNIVVLLGQSSRFAMYDNYGGEFFKNEQLTENERPLMRFSTLKVKKCSEMSASMQCPVSQVVKTITLRSL